MVLASEVIEKLEQEFPNDVRELKDKTAQEVAVYIAQLELIDRMRMIAEDKMKRKK